MKTIGGNSVRVRHINRELLRRALTNREHSTLAELSHDTGLSVATCANIVPQLVESGVAIEFEERKSQGGRPARSYGFNPDHAFILGLLLRQDGAEAWCRHVLFNAAGNEVSRGEEPYASFSLAGLDATVARLRAECPGLEFLALSIPGVVNEGRIEACDIPELEGVDLADHCRRVHGIDILVDNDMNLAAVGYQGDPSLPENASLAFVVLPEKKCPGSGLVINGKLVRGMSNFAGEISYIPFGDGGAAGSAEAAGRLVAVLAAVVNPHVVVLSGELVRGLEPEAVRRVVLQSIPLHHVPGLVIRPDYEADCFAGMRRLGLERLSGDLLLIEKEGLL